MGVEVLLDGVEAGIAKWVVVAESILSLQQPGQHLLHRRLVTP